MHLNTIRRKEGQEGVALLLAVILLLLMSILAVTSLQHSQQESIGSGRSRHHLRQLEAAEGMLQVVTQQLVADGGNKQSGLTFNQFIQNPQSGRWTQAMTSLPNSGGVQQDIVNHGGRPRSGDALGVGSPIQYISYSVNVTASDSTNVAGGRVGLQAQYAVLDTTGGGSYR